MVTDEPWHVGQDTELPTRSQSCLSSLVPLLRFPVRLLSPASLVGGSIGHKDLRHQAEVLRTYDVSQMVNSGNELLISQQLLIERKVKPENVILMLYDKVGKVYQRITEKLQFHRSAWEEVQHRWRQVLGGLKVHYCLDEVTPLNFLNVLSQKPGRFRNACDIILNIIRKRQPGSPKRPERQCVCLLLGCGSARCSEISCPCRTAPRVLQEQVRESPQLK